MTMLELTKAYFKLVTSKTVSTSDARLLLVKEVALAGGCVDKMVPHFVQVAMEKKFQTLGGSSNDKVKVVSLRD